jgi:hypothetical protein
MRLTVTNLSAVVSVDVPAPFGVTLAPSASKTLGVAPEDFQIGEDKGSPVWKEWDILLKTGRISVTPLADVGATDLSILRIVNGNILNDDLAVVGNETVGGTLTATGDIAALGGFRQTVGPFTAPGAAGVTAAGQTDLDCRYSHTVTAAALSFIAPRAGSIMGLGAQLSAAVTGAGQSILAKVTINGTELVGGPECSFTQAGAEVKDYAVVAKGAHPFVAGDIIGVSYTSDTITNTPALVASVEIEC